MSETKRTLAEIYSLLGTNTTRQIGATDVRDAVATLAIDYGGLYISASGVTTFADTTTHVPVEGTYALETGALDWDMSVNGQLRYTDAADRMVLVMATAAFTCLSNNQDSGWAIGKNGTYHVPSHTHSFIGTGADTRSIHISALVPMSTNDYLELLVANHTSTGGSITAVSAHIQAIGLAI